MPAPRVPPYSRKPFPPDFGARDGKRPASEHRAPAKHPEELAVVPSLASRGTLSRGLARSAGPGTAPDGGAGRAAVLQVSLRPRRPCPPAPCQRFTRRAAAGPFRPRPQRPAVHARGARGERVLPVVIL